MAFHLCFDAAQTINNFLRNKAQSTYLYFTSKTDLAWTFPEHGCRHPSLPALFFWKGHSLNEREHPYHSDPFRFGFGVCFEVEKKNVFVFILFHYFFKSVPLVLPSEGAGSQCRCDGSDIGPPTSTAAKRKNKPHKQSARGL